MHWIDSHCHLDRFLRTGELDALLARAKAMHVKQMIAVGTDPDDWSVYRDLSLQYPGCIYHTVGLHPCHVEASWEQNLQTLCAFFEEPKRPVALGEIGLDYFHLPKDEAKAADVIAWQKAAFARQLTWASQLDVPIVVHSRHAFSDCVAMIDASGFPWERVVFHCFGDGAQEVALLNERGGRASFTGIVTYKSAQTTREALCKQGLERLMLETDSPYLSPVPHRGKTNEPSYVVHVAESCAAALGVSLAELAEKTTQTVQSFFALE